MRFTFTTLTGGAGAGTITVVLGLGGACTTTTGRGGGGGPGMITWAETLPEVNKPKNTIPNAIDFLNMIALILVPAGRLFYIINIKAFKMDAVIT